MRCTLLLVASLAGLAVAQPIVECKNTSTSTLPKDEATEQPMPTPTKLTSGSLKPFKLPAKGQGSVVLLCGVHINSKKLKSEDCVGTERFCNEALYRDLEETFASPEECLASQQPKKTAVTEKDLRKDEATKLHEDAVSCFDALDEVFKQCRESKMDDCRKGKADVQQCKSEADKQCVLETEDEAARCRKLPDTVPGKERDPLNNQAAQKSERKKIDDHCGRFGDDGEKKSECNLAVRRCVGRTSMMPAL
ncbi:hypothetical protein X797_011006 [Metarhizium robertsii]|uniref:Uncharacterized protein n=1 Tax=Metarhizium robertsii TaxID=568076 RepID=A0A014PJK0_9HYPO|nr:hypothetical protein X797_011006 [Metarhizium robertsii]